MPSYRTILCAIDFSDNSRYALELGFQIAKQCRTRLVAFHAIETILAEAGAAAYDRRRLRDDLEAELRAFTAGVVVDGTAESPGIIVEVGEPARAILDCARQLQADLILMGTQGLGGLRKAFFGSITEKVLRGAFVPVLAVKPTGTHPAAIPTGIVAAIDFDESAPTILQHAVAFANEFRIPLTLLHVVAAVQALPQYTDALTAAQADRVERARKRLEEEAARLNVTPHHIEVRTGSVADEIAELMTASPGAILAIGTGGARMLRRPGSTAYRVLNLTSAPVLTIPDKA
jgi:nucleotide-binding universal stress UspA family protein